MDPRTMAKKQEVEQKLVEIWNQSWPVGKAVRYWPGLRKGEGVLGTPHGRRRNYGQRIPRLSWLSCTWKGMTLPYRCRAWSR